MSAAVPVLTALLLMAFAGVLLQRYSPAFALLLSLGAAVWLLLRLAQPLRGVLQAMVQLGQRTNAQAFSCLLRSAGILLLADYVRTLCEEAGADTLAWCAGLAGRCLVLAAVWPLLEQIFQTIWGVGRMKKCGLIICMATLGFLCSKTALKAAAAEATPWQTYLDKAPVQAEQFAADPLGTLVRLFAAEPVQLLRDTMQQYADVLLFLSLAAGLAFLLQDTADRALLELAAAGGCGVLLWQELDKLAAALCTRMAGWKSYLLGFLPVYSGVLAAGGEWNAGAAANGFLLTVLCFIAQAVTLWLQPLLRSYLAISMACGISSRKSLFEGCTLTGRLLRQAIGWAGKAFAALMSIQRVVTVQLDRSASRLGQLLTGSVPIVGQALSNAADAVLAGMQLLKSTLGIAALLSIGAEFAPLYLGLLIHLLFLSCCGWLAGIGGLEHCHKLLQCFAEAVRCMAAVTALFFMLFVVGIVLLMLTGGG